MTPRTDPLRPFRVHRVLTGGAVALIAVSLVIPLGDVWYIDSFGTDTVAMRSVDCGTPLARMFNGVEDVELAEGPMIGDELRRVSAARAEAVCQAKAGQRFVAAFGVAVVLAVGFAVWPRRRTERS